MDARSRWVMTGSHFSKMILIERKKTDEAVDYFEIKWGSIKDPLIEHAD